MSETTQPSQSILIFDREKSGAMLPVPADLAGFVSVTSESELINVWGDQGQPRNWDGMVIVATQFHPDLDVLLRRHLKAFTPLMDNVLMVAPKLNCDLMALAYEYGIEEFCSAEALPAMGAQWLRLARQRCLQADVQAMREILDLAIRGDQPGTKRSLEKNGEMPTVDFRLAYVRGVAYEVLGKFEAAARSFKDCFEIHPHFTPARFAWASANAMCGKRDEAITALEELDRKYDRSPERKSALAAAYAQSGDAQSAEKHAAAALAIAPNDGKAIEAKAYALLLQGKAEALLEVLDRVDDGGPYLAARLNDMAIDMAKAGNIKGALALYDKTHRIVRKDLRYKVSLNIAITHFRSKQVDRCRFYIDRCETEYGGTFEKIEKMREALDGSSGSQAA